ncbi:hypothetical protein ACLB1G_07230 [Oxalobacteraceae bacterium A2-2]
MKRTIQYFVCCVLGLHLIVANAGEDQHQPVPWPWELDRAYTEVKIALNPPGLLTRTRWNESDLLSSSCIISTTDAKTINLVKRALSARITGEKSAGFGAGLRNAIYLRDSAGGELKLLLDDGDQLRREIKGTMYLNGMSREILFDNRIIGDMITLLGNSECSDGNRPYLIQNQRR